MPHHTTQRRFRARATPQHVAILPTEIPIPKDRRNVVPEVEATELFWYACTTVPQGERRAAESLRREAPRLVEWGREPFVAYVPCSTVWKERKRGTLKLPRLEVQTPIARSYLFVGVKGGIRGAHLGVMSERNVERQNRHGLIAVLGSAGGIPIALGGQCRAFLEQSARRERGAAKVRTVAEGEFTVGDGIEIADGPFASYSATVTGIDAVAGRLLAEVDLFGRMTPIELNFTDVRQAA